MGIDERLGPPLGWADSPVGPIDRRMAGGDLNLSRTQNMFKALLITAVGSFQLLPPSRLVYLAADIWDYRRWLRIGPALRGGVLPHEDTGEIIPWRGTVSAPVRHLADAALRFSVAPDTRRWGGLAQHCGKDWLRRRSGRPWLGIGEPLGRFVVEPSLDRRVASKLMPTGHPAYFGVVALRRKVTRNIGGNLVDALESAVQSERG